MFFSCRKWGRVWGRRRAPNPSTSPSGTARACRRFVLGSAAGAQTDAAVHRTPPKPRPSRSAARTEPCPGDWSCSSVRVCATVTARRRTGYRSTRLRSATPPSSPAEAPQSRRHERAWLWQGQQSGVLYKNTSQLIKTQTNNPLHPAVSRHHDPAASFAHFSHSRGFF